MVSEATPSPWAGRRIRLLLLCLFLVSLPAVTARLYSSDEIQYYAYLRSLWFDHDLSFDNEYRHFYDEGVARSDGFRETFLELTTDRGRRINFGTIGCAILWSPFYAVADLYVHATGGTADGYSRPYIAAVAYGSAVYGFAALLMAIAAARRLGYEGALAATAVWLGTPLLFYMYVAPPFSHACSAFAVALFVWTWLRVRGTWTVAGLAALGAAAALMAMVREQDAFFVAGPALDFLLDRRPLTMDRLRAAVAGAAAGMVAYLPQASAYLRLNGHLGPHASVARKMTWYAPHAGQVLLSPAHGYFFWTPLALIAIAGLATVKDRRAAAALLLMVALQVYVGGSVESWTVAGGFGQRRFVALSAVLVIGLAAVMSVPVNRASRWTVGLLVVVAVYWNLAVSAEFAIGLMDRQKLEPGRNAVAAFVTIPREAPSLAWRYLFDRHSFYQPRRPE